jgi:MYXO-CTERM domain-containing protein
MSVLSRRTAIATILAAAAATSVSGVADAAYRSVNVAKRTIQESNGRWKVKFTINWGRKPDRGLIPMQFSFKPKVLYEWSLTDEKPKGMERRVPLTGQPDINVPVDVSFEDPATGKKFKTTKFSIKLDRRNEFEAGEYELTCRTTDGKKIGRPIRLILKGRNKAVDRRSMVFEAKVKGKGDKKKKDNSKPGGGDGNEMGSSDGPMAAEDAGPDLSDIPDEPMDDAPGPPSEKPGTKASGCSVASPGVRTRSYAWLGLLALGAATGYRRPSRRREE